MTAGRDRAAAGVRGLLRTPGARRAAAVSLVVAGLQMVIAMPWAWGLLRHDVAGVTIDVGWLAAVAMPLLLALTLFLGTAPHLLPGKPAARPGPVTGVLSALQLTALGALVGASFGSRVVLGITLLVQVVLIAAFASLRAGDVPPVRRTLVLVVVYATAGLLAEVLAVRAVPDVGGWTWWMLFQPAEYVLVAAMAVLAWRVNGLAGVGGTLFVVVELLSMLQVALFTTWPPGMSLLVAPVASWCHVLAPVLITAGVLRRALSRD